MPHFFHRTHYMLEPIAGRKHRLACPSQKEPKGGWVGHRIPARYGRQPLYGPLYYGPGLIRGFGFDHLHPLTLTTTPCMGSHLPQESLRRGCPHGPHAINVSVWRPVGERSRLALPWAESPKSSCTFSH